MFLSTPSYLAEGSPDIWLVQDMLPIGGLLNIYGGPKQGKTYAAMDLAMAVSDPNRTHWLIWKIVKHGPVWYLQIDTPRGLFQDRWVKLINVGHYVNGVAVADKEMVPYPFNVTADGGVALRKAVEENGGPPALLVVDTLRDAHGFDENESGIMRNVVAAFVDAMSPKGYEPAAIVFLTHSKKVASGDFVDLMSGSRGSNYLAGRVDGVMRFQGGIITAQSRSIEEVSLKDCERNKQGLWVLNDVVEASIAEFAEKYFRTQTARAQALAEAWNLKVPTAKRWLENKEKFGHRFSKKKEEEED